MKAFDEVWNDIQTKLHIGTVVKNWTAFGGYLGDTMKVDNVNSNMIVIDAPRATTLQQVSRDDFKKVWQVWADYKTQKVKRFELRDLTRFSKYIISVFHWYEDQTNEQAS